MKTFVGDLIARSRGGGPVLKPLAWAAKSKRRLAATLLLGLWACSDPLCTLIGCHNGLLLTFDRTPEAGTIITIEDLGFPVRLECDVGAALMPTAHDSSPWRCRS